MDEDGHCALCRLGATQFHAAYSFGEYEGDLRKLIHLYKYRKIRTLAEPLGRLLSQALPRDEQFDCIVPVPLDFWKIVNRGFRHTTHLARALSQRTNIPVEHVLRRRTGSRVQAGLSHAQRRENVRSVFSARRRIEGARVLLLDDVFTTGATANACAQELRRAGAARIVFLSLARVDRRMTFSGGSPAAVNNSTAGAKA